MYFLQLWAQYFAPFFKIHKKLYLLYITIILIFYFIQALILPRILSQYTHEPTAKWLSVEVFRRFSPLLGIFFLMIVMIFLKNRIDAILPTMHFKWLRETMFKDMIWSYREQKDSIPIGVFMMRYNLLPQEIRVIFEDILETFPVALSLMYLFIYFCTFDVSIGLIYLGLYLSIFAYLFFSRASIECQKTVEIRALETLRVNDTASQEVLNLNHIYANQVEKEHIMLQSEAEGVLQKKWEHAQKAINGLLFQINLMQWVVFGILLALFYRYFRRRPGQKQYWPAVFLVLSFTQNTLMTATPRWLGLLNGFTMIRIYHQSIMSLPESVDPNKLSATIDEAEDHRITIDDMSLTLGNKVVFADFRVEVPQGQKILVQGASGSGKSTLFQVLTRYITSYTGNVRIGDIDLQEWDLHALRKRILYIPQQTQLFDRSILYNICMGECPPEKKEQIETIIRRYGWERILGNDLDKSCGGMGKNVSHGMQKLIVLLRLLWRIEDARIVLIDEPLASLDRRTQDDVLDFLLRLTTGRTLLITNHVSLTEGQNRLFDRILDSSSFVRSSG